MDRQKVETTLNQMKRSGQGQDTVTLPAAGACLVPFSEDRVALLISSHPTSLITLSLKTSAGVGLGINIYPAAQPLSLNLGTHGSIVKGPIYVADGTFPMTLTFLESLNSAT